MSARRAPAPAVVLSLAAGIGLGLVFSPKRETVRHAPPPGGLAAIRSFSVNYPDPTNPDRRSFKTLAVFRVVDGTSVTEVGAADEVGNWTIIVSPDESGREGQVMYHARPAD